MIKAETLVLRADGVRTDIRIKVKTSIDDDVKDIGEEILKAELVSIFKQLDKIDSEILLDALEIYERGLKNDD